MWEYRATVIRFIDGDTMDALLELGFYAQTTQRLRLLGSVQGVNTPELHAADPAVRERAVRAAARCRELAPAGSAFVARTSKGDPRDGFGRFLAQVILADGRNLGDVLLAEGLAVPYVRGG